MKARRGVESQVAHGAIARLHVVSAPPCARIPQPGFVAAVERLAGIAFSVEQDIFQPALRLRVIADVLQAEMHLDELVAALQADDIFRVGRRLGISIYGKQADTHTAVVVCFVRAYVLFG